MAVSLLNADSALKSVYLDVVSQQLNNNINPFLTLIKKNSNNVWGKEIRRVATHGVNGGVNAGTEDGSLPKSSGNDYAQFVTPLKNLYGVIEISDKAVRASENNAGAFVNLLNEEMEGLIRSSKFNFSRMLFGDGIGILTTTTEVKGNKVKVVSTKNITEGMLIDLCIGIMPVNDLSALKVCGVNHATKEITLAPSINIRSDAYPSGLNVTVQGSYGKEITGLGAIFNTKSTFLYGLKRADNPWINPYVVNKNGAITELDIQKAIDDIEEKSGSHTNIIICSLGVRRALMELFSTNKRVIDTTELAGGFKAMSYNGIPIVADRFCPEGTMYLLNSEDFTLHQLCDWQWLSDDDGRILKQVPGKPVYTATLVKYADLLCDRPYAQGAITGITEK